MRSNVSRRWSIPLFLLAFTALGGGSLNVNYTYDRVGNRLTRNAETSAYDANDQLAGPVYDDNGNTTAAWLPDPFTGLPRPVADQYDFEDRLKTRTGTLNFPPSASFTMATANLNSTRQPRHTSCQRK